MDEGRRRLGRAGRHLAAVLRRQGVRGGARRGPRARRPTSSTSRCSRRLRRVRAHARARRADRRQRRQPRPQARTGRCRPTSRRSSRTASACCCAARSSGRRPGARPARARGARSSSPANPVLRDLTERVIIASKGRFDRALNPANARSRRCRPRRRIFQDEFMEATTDVWELPPESATSRRPPGAVPGRAPRAPDRALHLRAATSCSTRSWVRAPPPSPRCAPAATTSATTPTPTYIARRGASSKRTRGSIAEARRRVDPSRRAPSIPVPPSESEDFQDARGPEGRAARDLGREVLERVRLRRHRGEVPFREASR